MQDVITRNAVLIDFPEQAEKITSPTYTFRIAAAPEAEKVEVSINESDWLPCRSAAGFFWYDWSGYLPGRHELLARVHLRGGDIMTTEPRTFRVELHTPRNNRREQL